MLALLLAQVTLTVVALVFALALYRQAHLLSARIRLAGLIAPEGPEVGDVAPPPLSKQDAGDVLFLLETCPSTPEVLRHLQGRLQMSPPLSVVIISERERLDNATAREIVQPLVEALPSHVAVYRDGVAIAIADAARIRLSPFYLRVSGGLVSAKHHVRGIEGLSDLLERRRSKGMGERRTIPLATRPVPVPKNGVAR